MTVKGLQRYGTAPEVFTSHQPPADDNFSVCEIPDWHVSPKSKPFRARRLKRYVSSDVSSTCNSNISALDSVSPAEEIFVVINLDGSELCQLEHEWDLRTQRYINAAAERVQAKLRNVKTKKSPLKTTRMLLAKLWYFFELLTSFAVVYYLVNAIIAKWKEIISYCQEELDESDIIEDRISEAWDAFWNSKYAMLFRTKRYSPGKKVKLCKEIIVPIVLRNLEYVHLSPNSLLKLNALSMKMCEACECGLSQIETESSPRKEKKEVRFCLTGPVDEKRRTEGVDVLQVVQLYHAKRLRLLNLFVMKFIPNSARDLVFHVLWDLGVR